MRYELADAASRALPGAGDRVLVLGLGVSGEAAARHLLAMGCSVAVADGADDETVRERAARLPGAEIRLGREDPDDTAGAALVVVAPGVPPSSPVSTAAHHAGIPVWGEVELAYRMARAPILGVTGTNGKTTVTEMLASALAGAGRRVRRAGNIGDPLSDAAASDCDVIAAELSSFQLHSIVSLRCPVAALLNVAPDHLDWHGSLDAYGEAKSRIFENQRRGDTAVVHTAETGWLRNPSPQRVAFTDAPPPENGAGVLEGWIVTPEGRVVETARLRVRGRPNLGNAVAAAAVAAAFLGEPARGIGEGLAAFAPRPHRMEVVASVGGVSYVNDSKATNPHATAAALSGVEQAVLIAGGRNKGLDLSALAGWAEHLRAAVVIGEAGDEIEQALTPAGVRVERAGSMDEAVDIAAGLAAPGDSVLLSPACASFDMFADYRARGEAFRAAVKRLEARENR